MANDLHIRDYINVLHKRRYSIYTFGLVVIILVGLVTVTTTPVYKATTKLLIEKVEPYTLGAPRYGYADPDFYATQYQIIQSLPVAEKVLDALKSDEEFKRHFENEQNTFFNRLLGGQVLPDGTPDGGEVWRMAAMRTIMAGIIVRPVRDTRIVEVSYMSRNPALASLVANTVAKAYIEALLDIRINSSKINLQWMSKKIEEERTKLELSERALQGYMQTSDIITLEDRVAIVPQKLNELSTQLTRAETRRKELESLYGKLRDLPSSLEGAESISSVAADSTVTSLRDQILKSEQSINELTKKYGAKHPAMIEALGDLKGLKEKRAQEIRRVIQSVKTEYELALQNERSLNRSLADTKQDAQNLNEKFIQYGVLKRNVDTNRQLFDSLLKRMGEQSINEEIQTVSVVLLEAAETPESPERPRITLNLMAGVFFALFGGVSLAFLLEYTDTTLKSPDEAEARLGIPVLGMINIMKREKSEIDRTIEKIVLLEPKSTFTENYKALRTAVMLSSADAPPKSILVTSMGPEDGKTSTAINLALAIAQGNSRVLLIDCDLRKPRVHRVFGLDNKIGISTYLAGDSKKIIQKGPLPNMGIIPSGPIPPNPSELLSSPRFKEFLDSVAGMFDFVVCDSPPLMSVTDAFVLSRQLEGTIIVARAGKTSYDMLSKGIKMLKDIKARVLGILVNAIDLTRSDYYYYKYHDYYYYYSRDEEGNKKKSKNS